MRNSIDGGMYDPQGNPALAWISPAAPNIPQAIALARQYYARRGVVLFSLADYYQALDTARAAGDRATERSVLDSWHNLPEVLGDQTGWWLDRADDHCPQGGWLKVLPSGERVVKTTLHRHRRGERIE